VPFIRNFRPHIVRLHFDNIAVDYDKLIVKRRERYNDGVDEILTPWILSRTTVERPLDVLDLGCGTGSRWEKLRQRLSGSRAIGCDITLGMCSQARNRGAHRDVCVASMSNLPFKDNSFDVVLCLFFVLSYATSKRQRYEAILEIARVLRPNGLLCLDVINRWHRGSGGEYRRNRWQLAFDAIVSWLDPRLAPGDKLYSRQIGQTQLPGYFHAFSRRELVELLSQAGFEATVFPVAYDDGHPVEHFHQGQILALCWRNKASSYAGEADRENGK
jgi:ubiquinone/menaquinone biosynthesis C-methylase UbiE